MQKKRKAQKQSTRSTLSAFSWKGTLWIVALVVVVYLGYTAYQYQKSGLEKEGLVVCSDATCYMTMHMHAEFSGGVCGEELRLPLETGPLDGAHTHKERNLMHFHDKVSVEKETKRFLDTSRMQLGAFFDAMNVRFTGNCLAAHCNGDACPDGKAGTLTMKVNGIPNTEYRSYVWKDDDRIELIFG